MAFVRRQAALPNPNSNLHFEFRSRAEMLSKKFYSMHSNGFLPFWNTAKRNAAAIGMLASFAILLLYLFTFKFFLLQLPAVFPTLASNQSSLPTTPFRKCLISPRCVSKLHDMDWHASPDSDLKKENGLGVSWKWKQKDIESCGFQVFKRHVLLNHIAGSWIVVAGDSQARLFFVALLHFLFPEKEFVLKRHSNLRLFLHEESIQFDFVWNPFPENISNSIQNWTQTRTCPDFVIMAAELWHALWLASANDYERKLTDLKETLWQLQSSDGCRSKFTDYHDRELYGVKFKEAGKSKSLSRKDYRLWDYAYSNSGNVDYSTRGLLLPTKGANAEGDGGGFDSEKVLKLFWLKSPNLIVSRLNSERKRRVLTDSLLCSYEKGLQNSKLLARNGASCFEIDLRKLSLGCGANCTADGMHYNDDTYGAAVQIFLNSFR